MQGHLEDFTSPGLFRSFFRGYVKDLWQDFTIGSAQDLLTRGSLQDRLASTCTRPWARSSCQDAYKIWAKLSAAGEDLTKSWYKNLPTASTRALIQAPLIHGICEIFTQGPLSLDLTRISTRSSFHDLYRIMQGPLRGDFTRISTRSSQKDLRKIMQGPLRGRQQDLHKIFSWGPVQDHAFPSYRIWFSTLLAWYKVDGGTDVTPRGICQQEKWSK